MLKICKVSDYDDGDDDDDDDDGDDDDFLHCYNLCEY